jgi:hypothetical protein
MRRLVGQLSVAQVDLKGGGNLGCVFDGMAARDQSCGRAVRSLIPRAESGNCGVQVWLTFDHNAGQLQKI